jgi:hypothetical protein
MTDKLDEVIRDMERLEKVERIIGMLERIKFRKDSPSGLFGSHIAKSLEHLDQAKKVLIRRL